VGRKNAWGAKMKVSRSVKPGLESRLAQTLPLTAPGREPREEAATQMHVPLKNAAGRLSREDQRRLGDILQRVYDDVIRQGVPDRFRQLLGELDGTGDAGQAELKSEPKSSFSRQGDEVRAQGAGERDQHSNPLRGGSEGLNHPSSKGSH